jgi:hypothetical protein
MEENFSPTESLQLIQSMIQKARTNISESRFYFLLWGWYVFLAILIQFLLKVVAQYEHHYLVWLGVIPAVVITIFYSKKHNKSAVKTYIGDSMGILWSGIGISFFVLSFIISNMGEAGWYHGYPFFILFYGLGTFVSGRLLQFKPLIIGGIINWVLACVCVLVPYDYQLLITAAAILCSYIIPGHLIRPDKT